MCRINIAVLVIPSEDFSIYYFARNPELSMKFYNLISLNMI